ncbi:hypothetical protein AXG93_673s1570 [Marchantia polymorpha subsp. ruderalis]|uniref:UDP-glycosyltransferase n=1 Tax=Marchantia polymorpha subsp. ruderalis TaxID=1480154 RepID=A0A176WID2_MARPO|nr:hypothetical protein AXG93_673s1570 [Marchantia polymorpha subsp. ruderalis]
MDFKCCVSKRRAHLLLVPLDSQSHFPTFRQLLYYLADKRYNGVIVTVITTQQRVQELSKLRSRGDFNGLDLRLQEVFGKSRIAPNVITKVSAYCEQRKQEFKTYQEKLVQSKNDAESPSCIISDMFLCWLQETAEKLEIPWYPVIATASWYTLSCMKGPDMKREGFFQLNTSEKINLAVPGLEFSRSSDFPSDVLELEDFFTCHSQRLAKACAILVNTAEELDAPTGGLNGLRLQVEKMAMAMAGHRQVHLSKLFFAKFTPKPGKVGSIFPQPLITDLIPFHIKLQSLVLVLILRSEFPSLPWKYHHQHRPVPLQVPRVFAVGPMVSIPGFSSVPQSKLTPLQGFNDHTFECLQWLDKQPTSSVLYIAFGSVIEISSEETVELAYALEITNVKFLWVLKASSSTPLSKLLPPGFEARTKKRGFTTSWAPQTQILMHASIAGFMTHCGWNSILEGLCSGVSFIAWPLANDEQQNARFLVDVVKVGLEIKNAGEDNSQIKRQELGRVIQLLMYEKEGQEAKRNSLRMKKLVEAAVRDGGSSYQALHSFLYEITVGK